MKKRGSNEWFVYTGPSAKAIATVNGRVEGDDLQIDPAPRARASFGVPCCSGLSRATTASAPMKSRGLSRQMCLMRFVRLMTAQLGCNQQLDKALGVWLGLHDRTHCGLTPQQARLSFAPRVGGCMAGVECRLWREIRRMRADNARPAYCGNSGCCLETSRRCLRS
jgi:hypothetical protein